MVSFKTPFFRINNLLCYCSFYVSCLFNFVLVLHIYIDNKIWLIIYYHGSPVTSGAPLSREPSNLGSPTASGAHEPQKPSNLGSPGSLLILENSGHKEPNQLGSPANSGAQHPWEPSTIESTEGTSHHPREPTNLGAQHRMEPSTIWSPGSPAPLGAQGVQTMNCNFAGWVMIVQESFTLWSHKSPWGVLISTMHWPNSKICEKYVSAPKLGS